MFATAHEYGTAAGAAAHPQKSPFLATIDVTLTAELRRLGDQACECGTIGHREGRVRARFRRPAGARPAGPGPGRTRCRGGAAARHRRGPDAGLDGPRGTCPYAWPPAGHVLVAQPA